MVFTPSIIVALVLLLAFLAILACTVSVVVYRRNVKACVQDTQVDLEADCKAPSVPSPSLWSNLAHPLSNWWSPPAEPELPWPVLSVMPWLRPKGPLHRRILKGMMFWKKEEVKVSVTSS